jgi:ABC-type glutathione transport system ATPase component
VTAQLPVPSVAGTEEPPSAVLEVTDLEVHYGLRRRRRQALHGVSLSVAPGETVGVIGETGSGKSTFARAVLGLVRASAGRIVIGGHDVSAYGNRQWRGLRRRGVVQYVFQDPLRSLDPDRTLFESIAEGLQLRGDGAATISGRVRDTSTLVGLDHDLLDRHPGEVSGGQRQRAAIARAMVLDPELLICDEPVSALDATTRIRILELLVDLRARVGVGILLITHDLATLGGLADRVVVLYRGHVVEHGTTTDLFTAPQHPYTRLLLASIPTIDGRQASAADRRRLRDDVAALSGP